MKFAILALTAIATVASAQLTQAEGAGVPECALTCIASALPKVGCEITDVACQCGKTDAIQAAAGGCIVSACTKPGELNSAIANGGNVCVQYSKTAGSTPSGSSPATTTGTDEPTTTITSRTTQTSTVTAETTSIPIGRNSTSIISSTGSTTSTGTITSAGSVSSAGTAGASPTSSSAPAAAPSLAIGLGSIVGALAAVAAAVL